MKTPNSKPFVYLKNKIKNNDKNTLQAIVEHRNNTKVLMSTVTRPSNTKIAVVIHLYYTDSWSLIKQSLVNLSVPFSIFVSLTENNKDFSKEILSAYPDAYVYIIPNRGRDVLPFMKLAPILSDKGYQYVLKLHSKKSTHRKDGKEWSKSIIEGLLPPQSTRMNDLMVILDKKTTGLVGPKGQYLQLTVNFEANGAHMTKALNSIYHNKDKVYEILQTNRANYGFFAGTMFWARLDALEPLIKKSISVKKFEAERGQIDGTFAHALERLFSLIPEVEGRYLYEIGGASIDKLRYDSGSVPDWSNVYIGPQSKTIK